MNHNNTFFLQHLCSELDKVLQGSLLEEAFSTSKTEAWLVFKTTSGSYFNIKLSILKNDCVLSFPTDVANKNRLPLFKNNISQRVTGIQSHPLERSFQVQFQNQSVILVKLHGKNGNLILFENNVVSEVFRRQIQADANAGLSQFDTRKNIDITAELLQSDSASTSKQLPFLPADLIEELNATGFFENKNSETAQRLLNQLNTPKFFICKNNNVYQLRFFAAREILGEYNSAIEALNDFARLYLGSYFFAEKKIALTRNLQQKIKHLEKEIASKQLKLQTIEQQVPYNQMADILMANLHQLQKGAQKAVLFDFYRDKEIEIKLKKEQSPQENAENYYRKSKNQATEEKLIRQNLEKQQQELQQLEEELQTVENAADSRSLKKLAKEQEAEEEKPSLFKEFTKSGFTIWVGKNSENNDLLTMKYAHKADIWLHARGVGGSHVVIRHQSGKKVPADVLEYAAQLAAHFSKGRTDSLCPVIYTERKYIRKPKGSAPGQVAVEKENVLMVKPGV